jgi:hypothetical protein
VAARFLLITRIVGKYNAWIRQIFPCGLNDKNMELDELLLIEAAFVV